MVLLSQACSEPSQSSKASQVEVVPVLLATSRLETVPRELHALGTVEALATVEVISQVTGVVRAAHFREGEMVERGQLLFSVDTRPYQSSLSVARAESERNRALFEQAEEEASRQKQLFDSGLSTEKELRAALANQAALSAIVAKNRAEIESAALNVEYTQIRAPIEGRTGSILVTPGNIVKANEPKSLVVVRSLVPIRVRFAVPEEYLGEVRGRTAGRKLEVEAKGRGAKDAASRGYLELIESSVDPATGTIGLRAEFPNLEHELWPGQAVDVRLVLDLEPNRIVVPDAAVQRGQDGSFVFTVDGEGRARQKKVVVQRSVGGVSVIGSGLNPGERVVVEGQLRLRDGVRVRERAVEKSMTAAPSTASGSASGSASSAASGSASSAASSTASSTASSAASSTASGSASSAAGDTRKQP